MHLVSLKDLRVFIRLRGESKQLHREKSELQIAFSDMDSEIPERLYLIANGVTKSG